MKHYAVTGRIPGDDEDTLLCVGRHPDNRSALVNFIDEIWALARLSEVDRENLRSEFGTDVFINSIVSSETPITYEA